MSNDIEDWLMVAQCLILNDDELGTWYDDLVSIAIHEAEHELPMGPETKAVFELMVMARLWRVIMRRHSNLRDDTTWGDE